MSEAVPPPRARTFDVAEIANSDPLGSTPRVPHLFPPSPFPLARRSTSFDTASTLSPVRATDELEAFLSSLRRLAGHDDAPRFRRVADENARTGTSGAFPPHSPRVPEATRHELYRRSSEAAATSGTTSTATNARALDPFFETERQNAAFERLAHRFRRDGLGDVDDWDHSCWPRGPSAAADATVERVEREKRAVGAITLGPTSNAGSPCGH
ncbi:hypothetical protein JCM11491_002760 [Sporobolomyces phaffii]